MPDSRSKRSPEHLNLSQDADRPASRSRVLDSLYWQIACLVLAWLCAAALHLANDGLWFQGDAPRHAANGLFWWDFVWRLPTDPDAYAFRYYARYPVIHPTAYPPAFYLLEGAAFALVGPSPFVAKGLVLATALMGSVYLVLWLRRWVRPDAGWGGVLLVLQPSVILWSNAIMLNIPSMTLGFAALYHSRRWIESRASRQLYSAAAFAVLAILTYIPTGVVVLVAVGWLLVARSWQGLWQLRVLAVGLLSALALIPWAVVTYTEAPVHVASAFGVGYPRLTPAVWTYYLERIPDMLSAPTGQLAAIGGVLGLLNKRLRSETLHVLIWLLVCYVVFSSLHVREGRYALLLVPALVILSVVALAAVAAFVAARLDTTGPWVFRASLAALLLACASQVALVRVPRVSGFREVAEFLARVAPEERVFYDGPYDGVLSFYVRAGDPGFQRGVVLGDKLLYSTVMGWSFTDLVHSPAEVTEALVKKCGCRWLAVEKSGERRAAASQYLRQALAGADFQLVRSFPIAANRPTQVDVFRMLLPVETPDELELRFPTAKPGQVFRVRPVQR